MDTRETPPLADELKALCPDVELVCGSLDLDLLAGAAEIIVSPGLDTNQSPYSELRAKGVRIIGDIELFAREAKAPIVAITGSNGKSTVTSLVGEMAREADWNVRVGGNIGVPALELIESEEPDLYVLELSSFQLETTESLAPAVATVLNLQADHLDRYGNMVAYHKAKQRIYRHCAYSVWNKQDMLTQPLLGTGSKAVAFTLGEPDLHEFGVKEHQGGRWLFRGMTPLMSVDSMKMKGLHNQANALAALALGEAVKLPLPAMLKALETFSGLPHRCEWVAELDGASFINDSKGTNVGATKAAIDGLAGHHANIILIAGGVGKGADFSELASSLEKHCKALIYFGEDGRKIADVAPSELSLFSADSLQAAIEAAKSFSSSGDIVLFSPACASFDMFRNFEHRGDVFCQLVREAEAS
jgi:UDP-N-acetylmuramoylalanine--D-glutamate ligase